MRKCGNCGEPGHNRRTCPELEVIEEVEQDDEEVEVVIKEATPKKKTRKCRACGEKDDHTAKNCPYKPLPEGTEIGPRKMDCGCWSWWKRDGKCDLCSRAIFTRHLDEEAA